VIDLLVVTYNTDLYFLEMQARSIDEFFKITDINRIIIVHNNLDGTRTPINLSLYGKFEHKVTEILFKDLELIEAAENVADLRYYGWRRQQFCKLFIASRSTSAWCLVLDSKLIFLKQYNYEDYFTPNNKAITSTRVNSPVFVQSNNWIEKFFELEPSAPDTLLPRRGTPLLMHTQTLRDVIAEVFWRTKINFFDWFMSHELEFRITEFDLYFSYIRYRGKLSNIYHVVDASLTVQNLVLLKNNSNPAQDFCHFIHSLENDYFHTAQLNQEYINTLSEEHKDYWNNLLKYKNILKT